MAKEAAPRATLKDFKENMTTCNDILVENEILLPDLFYNIRAWRDFIKEQICGKRVIFAIEAHSGLMDYLREAKEAFLLLHDEL